MSEPRIVSRKISVVWSDGTTEEYEIPKEWNRDFDYWLVECKKAV